MMDPGDNPSARDVSFCWLHIYSTAASLVFLFIQLNLNKYGTWGSFIFNQTRLFKHKTITNLHFFDTFFFFTCFTNDKTNDKLCNNKRQ